MNKFYGLTLLLLAFSCRTTNPQTSKMSSDEIETHKNLFQNQSILKLRISAPLKKMFDAKDDRTTYDIDFDTMQGDPPWYEEGVTVSYANLTSSIPAKIRVRGGVTRGCSFPPIKLKVSKDDSKNTVFEGYKSFKIKTHCEERDDYRSIPYKEHAIYELYEIYSGQFSFRSRPLEIKYKDSSNDTEITEPALILEEPEDLAKRLDDYQEIDLLPLENTPPPNPSDSTDVRKERVFKQNLAMLLTTWSETIAEEEKRLASLNPSWTKKQIEETLQKEKDKIWRLSGLPSWSDSFQSYDLGALLTKMETKLLPLMPKIESRQAELKSKIDGPTVARILVFNSFILNTDWNVFGARDLQVIRGSTQDHLKNVKLLKDHNGRLYPILYDFNEASLFGLSSSRASEYKNIFAQILQRLEGSTLPTKQDFVRALEYFIASKSDLVSVIKSLVALPENDKANAIKRIEEFAASSAEVLR